MEEQWKFLKKIHALRHLLVTISVCVIVFSCNDKRKSTNHSFDGSIFHSELVKSTNGKIGYGRSKEIKSKDFIREIVDNYKNSAIRNCQNDNYCLYTFSKDTVVSVIIANDSLYIDIQEKKHIFTMKQKGIFISFIPNSMNGEICSGDFILTSEMKLPVLFNIRTGSIFLF